MSPHASSELHLLVQMGHLPRPYNAILNGVRQKISDKV